MAEQKLSVNLERIQLPGSITHLELRRGGPGTVFAKWRKAPGAERYKMFKQVLGVDDAPMPVAREVRCNEFTFIALPAGVTIEVTVTAANAAGYGAASAPARIEVLE